MEAIMTKLTQDHLVLSALFDDLMWNGRVIMYAVMVLKIRQ